MELWVTFGPGDPPCGHVARVGDLHIAPDRSRGQPDGAIPFTGWLGLLRVLLEFLSRPDDP